MPNTADYLRRTIARLHALHPRPDVVLATGDLTERGSPHEYRRLRSILGRLEIPHFLIPGNHDDREALRRAFRDHRYLRTFASHASFAIDAWPLRVIGLDSTTPGRSGGFVDDERLGWLDAELQLHPRRPTILAMHHPPFRTGVPGLDGTQHVAPIRDWAIAPRHRRRIGRIFASRMEFQCRRPHLHRRLEGGVEQQIA